MDAAEPARPHEADPDRGGGRERRRPSSRRPPPVRRRRDVTRAQLARSGCEALELRSVGGRRGSCRRAHRSWLAPRPAARTAASLAAQPRGRSVRGSRARRASSRARRRAAVGERRSHLVETWISSSTARAYSLASHDPRHGIAPGRLTQRAAASRASSGPPTSQPAARASPAPVVSMTSSTGNSGSLVTVERAACRATLLDPKSQAPPAVGRARVPLPRSRIRRQGRSARAAHETRPPRRP